MENCPLTWLGFGFRVLGVRVSGLGSKGLDLGGLGGFEVFQVFQGAILSVHTDYPIGTRCACILFALTLPLVLLSARL